MGYGRRFPVRSASLTCRLITYYRPAVQSLTNANTVGLVLYIFDYTTYNAATYHIACYETSGTKPPSVRECTQRFEILSRAYIANRMFLPARF